MWQAQRQAAEVGVYSSSPEGQQSELLGLFPERVVGFGIRACDIAGALVILIFIAPLLFFLVVAVKLQDGGPALFQHRRIGRGGAIFPCLKIRTMVIDADKRLDMLLASDEQARAEWALDHKLRDDPRITKFGRFLRKSSLDELPQLINVIKGEMSLVGPRPIVIEEAQRYGRWLKYYCAVRPGITGIWQVSGRNNLSYRRRVACDVLYSRRQSTVLNIVILLLTIPAVLTQDGSR